MAADLVSMDLNRAASRVYRVSSTASKRFKETGPRLQKDLTAGNGVITGRQVLLTNVISAWCESIVYRIAADVVADDYPSSARKSAPGRLAQDLLRERRTYEGRRWNKWYEHLEDLYNSPLFSLVAENISDFLNIA